MPPLVRLGGVRGAAEHVHVEGPVGDAAEEQHDAGSYERDLALEEAVADGVAHLGGRGVASAEGVGRKHVRRLNTPHG